MPVLVGALVGGLATGCDGGEQPKSHVGTGSAADNPQRTCLGTNLSAVEDWSSQVPFRDLFKMSRVWISGGQEQWQDGRVLKRDEHGNVTELAPDQTARTIILTDQIAAKFPGRYIVTYAGRGVIEYAGSARYLAEESRPGRDVIDVLPNPGGVFVTLRKVASSDPIRDIRILPELPVKPGSPAATIGPGDVAFTPVFLDRLKPYSVLRFMDWQKVNNSTLVKWADRPKLTDSTWTGPNGVPIEAMISLCNQVDADPWFCVPHLADEEFVREFARLVDAKLEPERTIYIEHSNEVWNGMFEQSRHAERVGLSTGLARNPFEAKFRWQSERSVQVFRIWRQELKPERKLVRVMGGWSADPNLNETMLKHKDAIKETDALAIAPYFGYGYGLAESAKQMEGMTVDAMFEELRKNAVPEAIKQTAAVRKISDRMGIPLLAYEAGQHLVGILGREHDEKLNTLFDAVNRDPRMKDLYADYLHGWKESGGTLLMNFTDCGTQSKFGRWGVLEWISQPISQAPKYAALAEFAETNRPWWPEMGKAKATGADPK